MTEKDGFFTKIVEKCEDEQQEMKKKGLESKAMSNLSVDREIKILKG